MKFKKVLLSLPKPIVFVMYRIYDFVHYPELRKQCMHFGNKNDKKTLYLIRPISNSNEGLMSLLMNVCKQLLYAEKKGYTPVVDFKNYLTQYSENNNDVWGDYFYQVSNCSLNDAYESNKVILSDLKPIRENIFDPDTRFTSKEMEIARSTISKYIHINDNICKVLSSEQKKIDIENCVGLYLRGTDYAGTKPIGHYIQPKIKDVIDDINIHISNNDKCNIFLVTEDKKIYDEAVNTFGNRIKTVSFDSFIKTYKDNELLYKSNSINDISSSKYKRGLIYLVKILLLSKCKYIYAGNTCGSWAAMAFSKPNTCIKIYDLGKY